MEFKDIVMNRFASKGFTDEKISQEQLDELLKMIQFAPSSYNIQPWRVVVISDQESKEKLVPVSYNQPQIGSCSHLLVMCADTKVMERIDALEKRMIEEGTPEDKAKAFTDMMRGSFKDKSAEELLPWAQRQVYIALSNALNGAKSLGFDSCPMEGFSSEEYAKILELPDHIVPTVLCPIGIASDEPRAKVRFNKEDVVM